MDDYGDKSSADLPLDHKHPDDVRKAELRKYQNAYTSLKPEELLFICMRLLLNLEKTTHWELFPICMLLKDRSIIF